MCQRAESPSPDQCQGPEDVGKLFHDEGADIWYECIFDKRKHVFTWTILPPEDVLPGTQSRWSEADGGSGAQRTASY